MKYLVAFKEVNYGSIMVNANSVEEAQELAEEQYYNGNVFWQDTDLEMTRIKQEPDRGDAR